MAYQAEGADTIDSMLDLMRRLPPTRIEENVFALTQLVPDAADEFLGSVDQPLKTKMDKATGREYLTCDYNRDGDSYRWVEVQRAVHLAARGVDNFGCILPVVLERLSDHHGLTNMILH